MIDGISRLWRTPTRIAAITAIAVMLCAAQAAPDAYAPLNRYQGNWTLIAADGKTTAIENHCARTGLFFACEQVVNGAPAALVVFLPRGATAASLTYRTQALRADASRPGAWHDLTINGDDWTYGEDGPSPRGRTLNHFLGEDHIHFDVQTSSDGKTWTTTKSGEELRTR